MGILFLGGNILEMGVGRHHFVDGNTVLGWQHFVDGNAVLGRQHFVDGNAVLGDNIL